MASTPIVPFATWASGTNQNSIPANDNAMRSEIFQRNVNNATTAQPGSPSDGDCYIIQSTHTGAMWSTFTPKDLAIYKGGTWYAFAPAEGNRVSVSGTSYIYTSGAWTAAGAASRSPSIQSVTSSSTVTPTFSDDSVKITAQAAALTLANPTGTAIDMLGIVIRVKDNGTARAITYGSQYRAIGITLPTTTVISKTTYIAMIYNSDDTKWDCVATGTEA